MRILSSSQIREIDAYTILHEPIKSIDLMERASMAITHWIIEHMGKNRNVKVFAGPGNNGGDGLAIARQLIENMFDVETYIVRISDHCSLDCDLNLKRLKKIAHAKLTEIHTVSDFPQINSNDIVIDALFGSGLTRNIEGFAKEIICNINNSGAEIISIDIPSGLFSENNKTNDSEAIIKANQTLTFQLPKLAFLFPENFKFVGKWDILSIGLNQNFIEQQVTKYFTIDREFVEKKLIKRSKFAHKGTFGHVLLISGSYGKMGAAILASKASLRSGSGLVTAHIPKIGYHIMQTALPEAMISIDQSEFIFTDTGDISIYSAMGIGPGLGTKQNTKRGLQNLLEKVTIPLVIDADALNIIAEHKELLNLIPKNSILTPHPKEFERLFGFTSNSFQRVQTQIEWAVKYKIFIVLKGAHTSVACPDGTCYFNTTGNPGMATAGSGDVLTGIILSLLGQNYEPKDATLLSVFIHGFAADIAVEEYGQEALIASDIIENLGKAFKKLKKRENI